MCLYLTNLFFYPSQLETGPLGHPGVRVQLPVVPLEHRPEVDSSSALIPARG
jgi:hypothetical protein